MSTFPHTAAALLVYDAGQIARDKELYNARTNDEVERFFLREQEAMNLVREGFFLDTKEFNSHSNCMSVDIHFMRQMVKRYGPIDTRRTDQ